MGRFFLLRRDFLIVAFLAIATFCVFWKVINCDFVYDDRQYILDNPIVRNGLSLRGIAWAFTSTYAFNWHPLTWLSHMLDCTLFGVRPGSHHLINLLFHIANSVLLFFLLLRMSDNAWRSGFVAALFALHPLHVESVAWVAERKDVLSTFLGLSTIWVYVRYAVRKNESSRSAYIWVIVLFALGLLSKPMLVTLPFVLLLLDYWPLRRFGSTSMSEGESEMEASNRIAGWQSLVVEKSPLFVLSALSCVITYLAQHKGGAVAGLQVFPFSIRLANAFISYVAYIWKMFVPKDLAVFYPHPGHDVEVWQVLGAFALLVLVTTLVFKARKSHPYLLVGWLWYLGTLVPVIGLVQVGMQSMADRYTYIPLIGLFMIIAWGIPDLLAWAPVESWRRSRVSAVESFPRLLILVVLAGTTLATMACIAHKQVRHWRNNVSLFRHALDVTRDNYLMENNLGFFLMEQGKLSEAERHFREALRINPRYGEAHVNLGNIFSARGKEKAAFQEYLKAVKANPRLSQALFNLGCMLERQGKIDSALDYYRRAADAAPGCAEYQVNVGRLLANAGRFDEACERFERAVEADPGSADAHYNLGCALVQQGKPQEAKAHFELALKMDPDNIYAHLNLGAILVDEQRINEGIAHYMQALKIKPDFAAAHHNLAIAYYFMGNYGMAWREIAECRKLGMTPNPDFIRALSEKAPEVPKVSLQD